MSANEPFEVDVPLRVFDIDAIWFTNTRGATGGSVVVNAWPILKVAGVTHRVFVWSIKMLRLNIFIADPTV